MGHRTSRDGQHSLLSSWWTYALDSKQLLSLICSVEGNYWFSWLQGGLRVTRQLALLLFAPVQRCVSHSAHTDVSFLSPCHASVLGIFELKLRFFAGVRFHPWNCGWMKGCWMSVMELTAPLSENMTLYVVQHDSEEIIGIGVDLWQILGKCFPARWLWVGDMRWRPTVPIGIGLYKECNQMDSFWKQSANPFIAEYSYSLQGSYRQNTNHCVQTSTI